VGSKGNSDRHTYSYADSDPDGNAYSYSNRHTYADPRWP
jgi:hypothetical protein